MRLKHLLVVMLSVLLSGALAQTSLSIATGGTGGVYYPYGGALAQLIERHLPGYTAVAEVTGASVENAGLVFRGDSDMAFALADTVIHAYSGTADFEGRPLGSLRAIGAVYPNAVQLVTLEGSGISSLQDLRGTRVSVGAPGSGTEVSARTILEANGITYDDFTPERLNFNETAAALRDGQIDAGFWSVGPPTSSILDLAATRSIVMVPLSEEEVANALTAEPSFAPYELAPGVYPGVDAPVPTISTPNIIIVSLEMDEELAYEIARLLYEHTDELIEIVAAASDTTVDFSLASTPIPLHPGALRYYQESGAEVPEHLIGD